MSALERLQNRLDALGRERRRGGSYRVPTCWVEPGGLSGGSVAVDPIDWWRTVVKRALSERHEPAWSGRGERWTRNAVVYNLLVRTAAAFDHDGDGRIGLSSVRGVRETGTFAKAIALLPYVRDLGCNTVHLLPITAIGTDGRKGRLGSPYAVRDPYRLDESLAEPILELGAEAEFAAFMEAAHRLGLRVVVEFVLRTAAKDSVWAARRPEWFYWIREGSAFGRPTFAEAELREIKARVEAGARTDLPAPSAAYREQFVRPEELTDVVHDGTGWVARLRDGSFARIPGAFSDWPPDDAQPPWSDVTYLRMYDHPDFDYMAYNTLRMYDARLARSQQAVEALWERIVGIVPHYQKRFGIDGALIDMGHALPGQLKARLIGEARCLDTDFAFWDEDFRFDSTAKDEGYDAVIGSFWWVVHRPAHLRDMLRELSERGAALPFLAAPETHNTPRCAAREGGVARSRLAWILGCFLPAAPFLHAGFELGETAPVNTGLDFSAEEASRYSAERLSLYSPMAMNWEGDGGITPTIRGALAARAEQRDVVSDPSPGTVSVLELPDERAVGYARSDHSRRIVVVGLFGGNTAVDASPAVPLADGAYVDPLSGLVHRVSGGRMTLRLSPWDAVVVLGPSADAEGR